MRVTLTPVAVGDAAAWTGPVSASSSVLAAASPVTVLLPAASPPTILGRATLAHTPMLLDVSREHVALAAGPSRGAVIVTALGNQPCGLQRGDGDGASATLLLRKGQQGMVAGAGDTLWLVAPHAEKGRRYPYRLQVEAEG